MAALNESDLYGPIKKLLEEQGYTVRVKVDRWDLVAARGGEPPVIIELQRRFTLPLVYQGIERQRITDAVYLAVAAPTGGKAKECNWISRDQENAGHRVDRVPEPQQSASKRRRRGHELAAAWRE
jgi:hypothetical protein